MWVLGIDLGGTKLTSALFNKEGDILARKTDTLGSLRGTEVGELIIERVSGIIRDVELEGGKIESIGISVPGISHIDTGRVWAPNIPDWEHYPLMDEMKAACPDIPLTIDSDRACYIMGEVWKGNAKGCRNAIFMAVGTGIGAGILINGEVANLVSLFNPEKIILGGGIFGPAIPLIPAIREEAVKWAQPVSINQVAIEQSGLGGEAGVYGAGYLALKSIS